MAVNPTSEVGETRAAQPSVSSTRPTRAAGRAPGPKPAGSAGWNDTASASERRPSTASVTSSTKRRLGQRHGNAIVPTAASGPVARAGDVDHEGAAGAPPGNRDRPAGRVGTGPPRPVAAHPDLPDAAGDAGRLGLLEAQVHARARRRRRPVAGRLERDPARLGA